MRGGMLAMAALAQRLTVPLVKHQLRKVEASLDVVYLR
jgi:hypothetical protein